METSWCISSFQHTNKQLQPHKIVPEWHLLPSEIWKRLLVVSVLDCTGTTSHEPAALGRYSSSRTTDQIRDKTIAATSLGQYPSKVLGAITIDYSKTFLRKLNFLLYLGHHIATCPSSHRTKLRSNCYHTTRIRGTFRGKSWSLRLDDFDRNFISECMLGRVDTTCNWSEVKWLR